MHFHELIQNNSSLNQPPSTGALSSALPSLNTHTPIAIPNQCLLVQFSHLSNYSNKYCIIWNSQPSILNTLIRTITTQLYLKGSVLKSECQNEILPQSWSPVNNLDQTTSLPTDVPKLNLTLLSSTRPFNIFLVNIQNSSTAGLTLSPSIHDHKS